MILKDIKKGDYFTVRPIDTPRESQVWVKGGYVHSIKAYSCHRFDDVNIETFLSPTKTVFVDFTF